MTPITVPELLAASEALIADPMHWTKRVAARDIFGCEVRTDNPAAVAYCALGACEGAFYKHLGYLPISSGDYDVVADAVALLDRAASELYGRTAINVNDSSYHSTVLTVYARARQLAESQEGATA